MTTTKSKHLASCLRLVHKNEWNNDPRFSLFCLQINPFHHTEDHIVQTNDYVVIFKQGK